MHLFLFDIDSHQWLSGLPQEVTDKCVSSLTARNLSQIQISIPVLMKCLLNDTRITVHDGFSDPLGWDTNTTATSLFHLNDSSAQPLINSLGEKSPKQDRAVVLDSLSSLLLYQSPAAVCRMIHTLGESATGRVVGILWCMHKKCQIPLS